MPQIHIREFRFPEEYEQVLQVWEAMEIGVRVGRSDAQEEIQKKVSRDPDLFLVAEHENKIIGTIKEEIQKKVSRDPDLFLVAEHENKIIGTIIGGFDGRRGIIYHLAVESAYRSQGVGTQLLNEVETRLRNKGCLKCYLMVTPENEPAMRYYEHHGWHHMDYVRLYGKELDLK